VLRTPDDLSRLVRECVEDAAASGAGWIEIAFNPRNHTAKLGTEAHVLEIVLDAMAAAAAETGVGAGLMMTIDRTGSPESGVELAQLARDHAARGVVSLGLANDEVVGPPEPFAEAFDVGRAAGLLSTPHAGELCGPESVRGALDALGADRIQHGVRAIEDADLVRRLADEQVCLDVCPTSNLSLSVVDRLEDHPLPALLAAGVPCSINADDPLLFGPGLLEEYEVCRTTLGLDDTALAGIAAASFAASGAPEELKASARAAIATWLAAPA
jgi:adenosine deaminase